MKLQLKIFISHCSPGTELAPIFFQSALQSNELDRQRTMTVQVKIQKPLES